MIVRQLSRGSDSDKSAPIKSVSPIAAVRHPGGVILSLISLNVFQVVAISTLKNKSPTGRILQIAIERR